MQLLLRLSRGTKVTRNMRVLFVGDIVGSPGRQIVRDRAGDTVAQRRVDLVIANGEIRVGVRDHAAARGRAAEPGDRRDFRGKSQLGPAKKSWNPAARTTAAEACEFPGGQSGSGLYIGTAKNGVKFAVLIYRGGCS